MTGSIAYKYQLDDCLDWITQNGYRRLILEFKNNDLRDSVEVVQYLKRASKERKCLEEQRDLDLYVTQANTCCVDLIVTQHVSDVDAIIHFGRVCLSKPHIDNQDSEKPILFAFGHITGKTFDIDVQQILTEIGSVANDSNNTPVCILYDSNLIDYAKAICDKLSNEDLGKLVEVACLLFPSDSWQTTPTHQSLSRRYAQHFLGQHSLSNPVSHYKSLIYLGEGLSTNITLQGPSSLWYISCYDYLDKSEVKVSRELNRRMALVDRLRDDEELKIGVIITNPLPNVGEAMRRLESYARARRHTLYFISMIQTIDECKIGNFDLCDAFVVINSCTCSTILETLCFNRPIINELEFKLACGFEATYGRVLWPSTESHLTVDDMINKRKVSDVSLALVHSRNEILERCSTARTNKWSGLDYKAAKGIDEGTGEGESLIIEEGLHGIASSYVSEPLDKPTASAGNDTQGGDADDKVPNIDCLNIKK